VIVLLHGVPETAAIWRKVQSLLGEPSVALPLPGFGNPRPAGFGATKEEYLDWVLTELAELAAPGEPIDLVGHDWGAILTFGIVLRHGEAVRSWAADVGSCVHPDYEWHAMAQIWQTPGDGEAFFEAQRDQPVADRAAGLAMMFGLADEDAREMAAASDDAMSSCILDLYRSATPNPHAHWGPLHPTAPPGLVVHATEDPFSDAVRSREVADALGASLAQLEGANHFWPYTHPEAAAATLTAFWGTVA
jgi:pimeloyl-ACP methyl ester carboxylesterase